MPEAVRAEATDLSARDAPEICIVMNAGSGKRRGREQAEEIEQLFERHPQRIALRLVDKGENIAAEARRAAEEGCGIVVAAGGDGTINAVAGAIAGTGAALGVIPLGTFNYVARSLGIPLEPEAALDAIVRGSDRPMRLGDVNGRIFLNNASLGAYAKILETRETVYRRFGRSQIAAHWSVLTTLAEFRSPLAARVTVDGEVHRVRTPLAFIANNPFQLEEFGFDEAAERVRQGELALFLAPDRTRFQLIMFALDLALGRLKPHRDFELLFGRDILVETRRPGSLVARDGERERMPAPFRFKVIEGALSVRVPPEAE